MTSLCRHCWKSYQYRSKFTSSNRYGVCLASFQIVDRISRQSSWTSCELCSHRRQFGHKPSKVYRHSLQLTNTFFKQYNAQYTPPTPTGRNCFVASAVWTHPSAVVTQFTISCADKWRHNDVIVWKFIKIHEYYTTRLIRMFRNTQRHNVTSSYFYSINCRIVNSVTADGCVHITESVGSRRELVANSVHTADADATQLDSWVASAVCIGHKST